MSKKYYIENLVWGVIGFCVFGYVWFFGSDLSEGGRVGLIFASTLSALLFPFSKKYIEDLALSLTDEKFWKTGFFIETPGKNGLYALFYFFCFVFSIPLGVIFICVHCKKKH